MRPDNKHTKFSSKSRVFFTLNEMILITKKQLLSHVLFILSRTPSYSINMANQPPKIEYSPSEPYVTDIFHVLFKSLHSNSVFHDEMTFK